LKDPENMVHAFKNLFMTVPENLNVHQIGQEEDISFSIGSFPVHFPAALKIIPTTKT
jgi:hypothetical protein